MSGPTQRPSPFALQPRVSEGGIARLTAWLLAGESPAAAAAEAVPRLDYRREIDGLRALAVIPVILLHAGFSVFGGGYVGVDVFFVISGYLITSLILSERAAGRFSLIAFYERRMRRILPALVFVILCCIPFAWALMLPNQLEDFAQSVLANAVFLSNILFLRESGYFAAAAEAKPLLHTWSLAIEEQFYVFFPALLLLAWRLGPRRLAALLLVFALASFAASQWVWERNAEASFFLLPTRAWELMIGVLAAFYLSYAPRSERRLDHLAAGLGLALIFFSVFGYDEATPFPSAYTLAPTLGALLIILFARQQTIVNRLLSMPLLVGLGLISYSAYLWHQPLLAFARITHSGEISAPLAAVLSAGSVLLAWFSWRFVEQPFRNKTLIARWHVFLAAGAGASAMLCLGFTGYLQHGFAGRWSAEALDILSYSVIANPREHECNSDSSRVIWPSHGCVYGNPVNATVAILGDSHASVLANALGERLEMESLGLRQFTYNNCIPVPHLRRSDRRDACPDYNREVYRQILEAPSLHTVILVARWTQYLEGVRFDNGEGGIEAGKRLFALPVEEGNSFIGDPSRIERVSATIKDGVETLLEAGKRVVIVYPVPEVGWIVPDYLAREVAAGRSRSEPLSTDYDLFLRRSANAMRALDAIGEHPTLLRIHPAQLFCDGSLPGRCVAQLDGVPLYSDENHMSRAGAALLSEAILGAMTPGSTALKEP